MMVQEESPGVMEVSAVDAVASMQAIENPRLGDVATEVQSRLKRVIAAL